MLSPYNSPSAAIRLKASGSLAQWVGFLSDKNHRLPQCATAVVIPGTFKDCGVKEVAPYLGS